MRKLRALLAKMVCALAEGLILSACPSEGGGSQAMGGKGAVILDPTAETVFDTKTKAVDESTYLTDHPLADYKVKTLDVQGHVVSGCEWEYSERPTGLIGLSNGSYTVVAFDRGRFNVNASIRNGIYVYNSSRFDMNSDKVTAVNMICKPACGKLVVKFSDTMATYFSDYAVRFSTQTAGENGLIIWPKRDTNPPYVKLAEAGENATAIFQFTKKADGTKAKVNILIREMKWGGVWTVTVNPKVEDIISKVGITITFDNSTNDKPIDIEIPSDRL